MSFATCMKNTCDTVKGYMQSALGYRDSAASSADSAASSADSAASSANSAAISAANAAGVVIPTEAVMGDQLTQEMHLLQIIYVADMHMINSRERTNIIGFEGRFLR